MFYQMGENTSELILILNLIREGKLNITEKLTNVLRTMLEPESGENVGHQQLISEPSPLLSVCCVEGVRDEQAAKENHNNH